MQPYQKASEEIRKQGEMPINLAKKGLGIASTLGGTFLAGKTINHVLPFLSKYIPEDLAIKGLTKADPRYGTFIDKALKAGKTIEEVKDFIGSKIEESGEQKAKEDRNIIQQYSPQLYQYITDQIQKGVSPAQAAIQAQKQYKNTVKEIEKDHKTPWTSLVESIFGGGQMAQKPAQNMQQPTQQPEQAQTGAKWEKILNLLQQINNS